MGLFVKQTGAICWVKGQVVLVSSDQGKSWDIPTCTVTDEDDLKKTTEEIAWEEAGVLGYVEGPRLGEFLHRENGKMYNISVYEIKARKFRDSWPKSNTNQRALMDPKEAAVKVDEFGLRDIFNKLTRSL